MSRGGHLGEALSALVDGELDHETRDLALAHVAGCASCRRGLEAERRLKAGVRGSPGPLPPGDLTRRLVALAEPGEPLPPRPRPLPGTTRQGPPLVRYPGSRAGWGSPGATLRGEAARRARRGALIAAGAVTIGGGAVSGAFLLAAPQPGPGAAVRAPVDSFVLERASVPRPSRSSTASVRLATFDDPALRIGPGVGAGIGAGMGTGVRAHGPAATRGGRPGVQHRVRARVSAGTSAGAQARAAATRVAAPSLMQRPAGGALTADTAAGGSR